MADSFYAPDLPESSCAHGHGCKAYPGLPKPQPELQSDIPETLSSTQHRAVPLAASSGLMVEDNDPGSDKILTTAGEGEAELATKAFNELCQQRHLQPDFNIVPSLPGGFVGTLRVDGKEFCCKQPQQSKKAVRKSLAKKGLIQLQNTTPAANEVQPEKGNWIGILQEFLAQTAHHPELRYEFEGGEQGPFLCTVSFSLKFKDGVRDTRYATYIPLPRKQVAKNEAAKAACLELARLGVMKIDGEAAERRLESTSIEETPSSPSRSSFPEYSYCERLARLASKYGMPPPRYELKPLDANCPSLLSGSVFFPRSHLAGRESFESGGPLGRVNNVFGQRNAKEKLAAQVLPMVKEALESIMGKAVSLDAD